MIQNRLKALFLYRHTLWDMAISQLKARYASSFSGVYSSLISPFLIMSVITFVFTCVFKVEMHNFPLFIFSGIIPWMFFSNALTESSSSILNQQNILRQFNLPREILPLSSVLAHFLNFLIGWVVLFPVFLFFNPEIFFLLPVLCIVLLLHLVLLLGLGLLLSVLTVLFRDIVYLLTVALMFLFWITPVFYSTAVMPAQYRWVFDFNPMVPFILSYQKILYYGVIPEAVLLVGVFCWSVMSVILGFIVFSRLENKILKNI